MIFMITLVMFTILSEIFANIISIFDVALFQLFVSLYSESVVGFIFRGILFVSDKWQVNSDTPE